MSGSPLDRLLALPPRSNLLERWIGAGDGIADLETSFQKLYDALLAELWVNAAHMLRATRHAKRALSRRLDERQRARLLRLEASALMGMGRARDALVTFQEAWDSFHRSGDRHEAARTTIAWVSALGLQGDVAGADRLARQGRRLLPRNAFADRARLEANLGGAWLLAGRYDRADERIRRAHLEFERAGLESEAGVCLLNLGMNALVTARFADARASFDRALTKLRATGNEQMAMYAEAGMAAVLLSFEDWDAAWEAISALRARFAARKDERGAAWLRRELGTTYSSLGAYEAAAPEAEAAWKGFTHLGLAEDAARAAALHSRVTAALGGEQLAVSLLERARSHWRRTGDRWADCRAQVEQARLMLRAGHAARALQALRRSLPTLQRRSPRGDAGICRALMAEAYLQLGSVGVARRLALRARRDSRDHPARLERPAMTLLVAQACSAAGRPRESVRWASRAVAELEDSLIRFGSRRLRMLVGSSRTRVYRAAVDLVVQHGGSRAAARALDLLSKARSPVLVEDLLQHAAGAQRPELRSALARLRDELLRDEKHPKARGARMRTLARELDAVASRLEPAPRHLPPLVRRAWAERSFGTWSRRLRDRRLVFFDRATTNWSAFIVEPSRAVRRVELPRLKQALVESWVPLRIALDTAALTNPRERRGFLERTQDDCTAALQQLRRALWDPLDLDADLPAVVIPDAELHAVPIEACIETGGAAPLLSRLPHPAMLTRPQSPVHRNALLLHGEGTGPERETGRLANLLRDAGWTVRRSASRAELSRGEDPISLLHVAAHGTFHREGWLLSGIRLRDGWLGFEQLPSTRLRGALLHFTSCESGLSGVYPGSDLEGWITAGLRAGARELVLTLWKIDDERASRFASAFYAHWLSDSGAAQAAARARAELRDRNAHPFAWAPFVAVA